MKTHNAGPGVRGSAGANTLHVMALVSAFFLDAEHKAQEFGMLPTLLVLAGPLMHVFMHHGQDDGHRQTGRYPSEDDC